MVWIWKPENSVSQLTPLGWRLRLTISVLVSAAVATLFLGRYAASSVMAVCVLSGMALSSRMMIVRSRGLPTAERRAWFLFGIGLAFGAAGLVVFAIAWSIWDELAVFGPIDLIWLTGYAMVVIGLALLPHASGSNWQRLRLFLDGVIGAVAVGALLWTLSIRGLTAQLATAGTWERYVGSAFVLLDTAVLVVLMIVLVRRSTYRFDLRLVLIAFAVIAQGIADYSFLSAGLGRSFSEAEPLYPVSILAVTLFVAASAIIDRQPQRYEYADRTRTPWWVLALPYSFVALMITVLLLQFSPEVADSGQVGLLHATLVVGGLVVARQAVSIRENQRSVQDQRNTLVASISHELRTPLTAMVGYLDLLDSGLINSDAEQDEAIAVANREAQHLAHIVDDLVMLASESETPMQLAIGSIRVSELVQSALTVSGIDVTQVRIDAERNTIAFVDGGRIQQALANYLTNATRYGGERVDIIAKSEGGDLIFEVHDDGPGVPRKYELRIWTKFERGVHRLNATVPGSGIGLAIVNSIAKTHGGSAGYRRSKRLGGACFWIRLPGRVQSTSGGHDRSNVVELGDQAQTA